jgi:hypothetical protein
MCGHEFTSHSLRHPFSRLSSFKGGLVHVLTGQDNRIIAALDLDAIRRPKRAPDYEAIVMQIRKMCTRRVVIARRTPYTSR